MEPEAGQVTQLLRSYAAGDEDALDNLVALVYDDLRVIARRQIGRLRFGETMNTTALVHEAYLKMVDQRAAEWQNRGHFFAISAHAMRQILVDHARRRNAKKRGSGAAHEQLDENRAGVQAQEARLVLDLDRALERLGAIDQRMVRVVECRFFAGMTEQETADALDTSVRTVQRSWTRARAWLKQEMG